MQGQRLPVSSTYHIKPAAGELHKNEDTSQQSHAGQNAHPTGAGKPGLEAPHVHNDDPDTAVMFDPNSQVDDRSDFEHHSSAEEAAAILAQLAASAPTSTLPSHGVGAAAAASSARMLLSPGGAAAAGFKPGQHAETAATASHQNAEETAAAAAGVHPHQRLVTSPDLPLPTGVPGTWQVAAAVPGVDAAQPATNAAGSSGPAAAAAATDSSGATAAAAGSKRVRLQLTGSSGRILWTTELHNAFLAAVQQLGGAEAATPTEILQLMNVEGLSRENVKSHLQKHRQHVREQRLLQQLQQVPGVPLAGGPAAAAAATGYAPIPKGKQLGHRKQQQQQLGMLPGLHSGAAVPTHCHSPNLGELVQQEGNAWQQQQQQQQQCSPVAAATVTAAAAPKGPFSRRRRSSSGGPMSGSAAAAAVTSPLLSAAATGAAAPAAAEGRKPRSLVAASSNVGLQLLQLTGPVGVSADLVAEAEAAAARGDAPQFLQQMQRASRASGKASPSSSSSNDGSNRASPAGSSQPQSSTLRSQQQPAEPSAGGGIVAAAASAAAAAQPQAQQAPAVDGALNTPNWQQSSVQHLQQQQQLSFHEQHWQQQQYPTQSHVELQLQLQSAHAALQKEVDRYSGPAQVELVQNYQQRLCYGPGRTAAAAAAVHAVHTGGRADDSRLDGLANAAAAEQCLLSMLQMLPPAQHTAASAAGVGHQLRSFVGLQPQPACVVPRVAIELTPALPASLATPSQRHLGQGACMDIRAAAAPMQASSQPGGDSPLLAPAAAASGTGTAGAEARQQDKLIPKPGQMYAQAEVSGLPQLSGHGAAAAAAAAAVSAHEAAATTDSTTAIVLSSVLHALDSTNRARLATVLQLLTLQGIISWHEPPLPLPCAPPAALGAILQAAILQQQQQQQQQQQASEQPYDPAAGSHQQ